MTVTALLLALTLGCEAALTNPDGTTDDGGDEGSTPATLVTDVEPADYETDTLATGEALYVDRDFTIQDVPSGYAGWTYVRTANDDKNATGDSAVVFTLQAAATVAVAYDERASTLPDWLGGWTATGDTLRTDDVDHPVYTRDFPSGEVALGGNMSGGAQGANSMYVLFASGSDDGDSTTTDDGDGTTATPTGVPQPDSNDFIHLDMREGGAQSIQKAGLTSIADVQNEYPSWNIDGTVEFTDDYDGAGTSAFLFPIDQWAGTSTCEGAPSSQQNFGIQPNIPNDDAKNAGDGFIGGAGRTVYLQFKRRFGRHPNDGSSHALGPVDDFLVHHHIDDGGPAGRKWMVWNREGGSARLDLLKQSVDGSGIGGGDGHVVLGLRRNIDPDAQTLLAQGDVGEEITPWWPDAHFPNNGGETGPFIFTLRLKFESSEGAGDGEMTWWVDGTQYQDYDGLFPGDDEVGNPKVGIVTWICPPQDQTEYFYDVVIWEKN